MNGKQLKNSILQWAIQGKLVPQDPNDEPASVLLERIREEKARLVKEKKIKKDKNESIIFRGDDNSHYEKFANGTVKCIDDEISFEIPQSWCWVRLGNIGDWGSGSTPAKGRSDYYGGNVLWLRTGELNNGIVYDTEIKITDKALQECSFRLNKVGDVMIAMYGATIGKVAIAGKEMTTNQACCGCTPICILNKFLFYFLMGSQDDFIKKGEGGAQPNISREKIVAHLMPLPPMEEQNRIVEKIESILPLIELYGKSQDKLNGLNKSIFPLLKKSVLQEAIQGKLVPQNPNDEPASVLLERIKVEKAKLFKEDKLKKKDLVDSVIFKGEDNKYYEKIGSEITCLDDDIPFDIPDNWSWSRFGCIMINRDSERIPLSVSERQHLSKVYDYYGASGIIDKVDKYLFEKDLLLIGEDGANLINRSTPIAFIASGKYWVNNHAHVLDVCAGLMLEYIALFINAISLVDYVTGTAQPKMNQEKMNSILVAVPPKEEQRRIVDHCKFVIASITRR